MPTEQTTTKNNSGNSRYQHIDFIQFDPFGQWIAFAQFL